MILLLSNIGCGTGVDAPSSISYYFDCAIASRAASTTFSAVNPNFFNRSLIGAEAPKRCIPIILPVGPTYCDQPNVDAASTDTRAFTVGGNTCLLYSSLCASKMRSEERRVGKECRYRWS